MVKSLLYNFIELDVKIRIEIGELFSSGGKIFFIGYKLIFIV